MSLYLQRRRHTDYSHQVVLLGKRVAVLLLLTAVKIPQLSPFSYPYSKYRSTKILPNVPVASNLSSGVSHQRMT